MRVAEALVQGEFNQAGERCVMLMNVICVCLSDRRRASVGWRLFGQSVEQPGHRGDCRQMSVNCSGRHPIAAATWLNAWRCSASLRGAPC